MLIVNIPYVTAWIVMYNAYSTTALYSASILLGLAVGLMEASIITYVGEIW